MIISEIYVKILTCQTKGRCSTMNKKVKRRENKHVKGMLATVVAAFSLIVILSFSSFAYEKTADTPDDNTKITTRSGEAHGYTVIDVYVNGHELYEEENYLINDTTYVPIRAFAGAMGECDISWSNEGYASVTTQSLEITAYQNSQTLIANGRYIFNLSEILNINSRIYVPVRSIAKAYSLAVEWNGDDYSVDITGNPEAIESADDYYDQTDLYWLSRIINAESAGEPLLGKIAVGNVVINRSRSGMYPDTIYEVIFDRKYGTQFTPVDNGTIYRTPGEDSVAAAKICLEGYTLSDEILFFINPRIASNNWVAVSREFAFTIGNHDFYS